MTFLFNKPLVNLNVEYGCRDIRLLFVSTLLSLPPSLYLKKYDIFFALAVGLPTYDKE